MPANCRLIDEREAAFTFAGDGTHALLVLGFEACSPSDAAPRAGHDPSPRDSAGDELASSLLSRRMDLALSICARLGGVAEERDPTERGSMGAWRDAFLRAPYLRDTFVAMGVLAETFETAITWDRHDAFVDDVRGTAEAVLRERCGAGTVTVRLTHAYPDGAAPYFTCLAPVERGAELETWAAVKHAASEAILRCGGTITHHHAVGRDHRPWYDRQRPDPFATALQAAKAAVDPAGILNPGVLF
jgi:alkyldihydroxyacetonephosphate synthase